MITDRSNVFKLKRFNSVLVVWCRVRLHPNDSGFFPIVIKIRGLDIAPGEIRGGGINSSIIRMVGEKKEKRKGKRNFSTFNLKLKNSKFGV